ncbi:MAG: ribose 5-phosphate isomerase B [Chloroflexi bacterium]|nr:ribose 5-phosphate isomerase B [Chloroflexota bacterium]
MRIALGSDHAGFQLKQVVIEVLQELGYEYTDFGCFDAAAVDYPDIARPVAEAVGAATYQRAILVCGTGAGMAIAANKVRGIRAVVANDIFTAHQAREHLDAHILCLGERIIGPGVAREVVQSFLAAEFEGGRHARRVAKVEAIEQELAQTPTAR